MKVLFVCLGNICRSPMLDGWMRARIDGDPSLSWLQVDSAGFERGHVGEAPDPRAIRIAREHGVDLSGQRARQIGDIDFDRFDLLLFADASTLSAGLRKAGPRHHARMHRVMEWLGLAPFDLADPWYGDAEDFRACWARVEQAGPLLLERLRAERRMDAAPAA